MAMIQACDDRSVGNLKNRKRYPCVRFDERDVETENGQASEAPEPGARATDLEACFFTGRILVRSPRRMDNASGRTAPCGS